MGMKEEVMGLAEEVEATVGGCVRCIADKPGGRCLSEDTFECSDAICREVAKRLRAIVEHGAEDVSVSAYDLLPEDEREAIAWVREHGGLKTVEARLMPEGTEWPKVDGKPVDFNTCYKPSVGALEAVCIYNNRACEVMGHDGIIKPVSEIHAIVNAADGEPLEAGQTVWDVESGTEYEVVGIHTDEDSPVRVMRTDGSHLAKAAKPSTLTHQHPVLDADGVEIRAGDEVYTASCGDGPWTVTKITTAHAWHVYGHSDELGSLDMPPDLLTHRAPVLAADGKPLREGETVWHKSGLACGVVETIDAGSLMHTTRYRGDDGTIYRDAAKDLVHKRPDTWERLEHDAEKTVCEYFGANYDCANCPLESARCAEEVKKDIIRRAKKLAERGA